MEDETKEPLVRVQFEMTQDKMTELLRLKRLTSLRTRRELFDNAFTFFDWGVTESVNGHLVAAVDEESGLYQPIMMPVFAVARRRAQTSGTRIVRPQRVMPQVRKRR